MNRRSFFGLLAAALGGCNALPVERLTLLDLSRIHTEPLFSKPTSFAYVDNLARSTQHLRRILVYLAAASIQEAPTPPVASEKQPQGQRIAKDQHHHQLVPFVATPPL